MSWILKCKLLCAIFLLVSFWKADSPGSSKFTANLRLPCNFTFTLGVSACLLLCQNPRQMIFIWPVFDHWAWWRLEWVVGKENRRGRENDLFFNLQGVEGKVLYNDMLWVVMNMLCFVSFLLMVCWNLHMPDVEIYTFSVNVVLMVCWNLCIPAYGKNWNLHIALLFRWIWGEFEHKMWGVIV